MAGPNLPTNRSTATSIADHVSDHNAAHNVANKIDKDATPATGQVLRWNGTVYVPNDISTAIDIRDFITGGVEKTSDPNRDDTAAFQAAITACAAYGDGSRRPVIHIAPGYYNVHEVSITNHVTFVGAHGYYNQVIRYNGAGGAGSALFKMAVPNPGTNAAAGGMFMNLDLLGYDGTTSGNVAESILAWGATSIGVDWGIVWHYVHMAYCYGDAVKLVAPQNSALVNLHPGPMRFDQIGGYAISLDCTSSNDMAQRIVELNQCTMDSRKPNGNFSTAAQADGVWNGTSGWGKGLLLATECGGTTFRISRSRYEINGSMAPVSGVNALVRINNTQAHATNVRLEDVLIAPQSADAMVAVQDVGSTLSNVSWEGYDGDQRTKVYQTATGTPANDVPTKGMTGAFGAGPSLAGIQGIILGGRKIEFRSAVPATSVDVDYQAGDTIINNTPGAAYVDGWVCYSPTTGFSNPLTSTIASSATWGTSNGIITPASANSLRQFPIGMNVILVGGGAAGVDLNGRVTATDSTAGTFTVNVTPSTAKAGIGSLKYQNPVWRQLGISRDDLSRLGQNIRGESFDRGNSTSSLLLISDTAYFSAVGLKAGDVVTNVVFGLETAGTQGGTGAFFVGLYNSTGTRLAISADATASAVGSTGPVTVALAAAYTVPADGLYYLMAYSNFATTQPSLLRGSAGGSAASAISGGARKYARQVTAGGTPPTSATLANGSVHLWLAWS